jgi:hypothetical protein
METLLTFNINDLSDWRKQEYFLYIDCLKHETNISISSQFFNLQVFQNLDDIIDHNFINYDRLNRPFNNNNHIYFGHIKNKENKKRFAIINDKICCFLKSIYILEELDIIQLINLDKTGTFSSYYIFSSLSKIDDDLLKKIYAILKNKFNNEFMKLIDLYLIQHNREIFKNL